MLNHLSKYTLLQKRKLTQPVRVKFLITKGGISIIIVLVQHKKPEVVKYPLK